MLLEISIEQFALIEYVRLQFAGGLNVLTGETGAGKSIILDAVQAVLGGRTSADVVRSGEERAVIEAVFDLAGNAAKADDLRNMGIPIEDDNLLVVRREIARNGRGSIRANGRTITVGMLREAAEGLVDLHGQHEHQSLLSVEKHLELLDQYGGSLLQMEGKTLDLLDRYGGSPLDGLRKPLADVVRDLQRVHSELQALLGDERDRARKEDLLRFQVEELKAARLKPGEEEELEQERQILSHAGKLKLTATTAYGQLYEGAGRQLSAIDLLGRVKADLEDVLRHDPSLADAVELVGTALIQVQEASHLLADYRDRIDDNPDRLARVDSRLDQIGSLKRKYGDSVEEMLAYLAQIEQEMDRLTHSQELIDQLKAEEARLGARAEELAAQLTAARREVAGQLSTKVVRELADLGMANARFEVVVEHPAGASFHHVTQRGWDRVEFLFSPNLGEPLKPLAKIISGGEMSRIMLALKVILARVDGVPTLVFDEIDTGISGRAAQAVGEKLARIASDRQVLCVTHLPQVAALADTHFLIAKTAEAGRTVTNVGALDDAGRTDEIARMIGGAEVSPFTIEAARDMLRQADRQKQGLRSA
ncbi:MAG TPA: DNA repair protein RecN [Symbiobacteriaceae bacterium]|nr:DNA repair protein RecN [Symbiobacteriaceae bacterium]